MKPQEFLKKFSTKKDAIMSVSEIIKALPPSTYGLEFEAKIDFWTNLKKEIESFQDKDLAQQVLDLFNKTYGTSYQNNEKIKAIIRNEPKATYDAFTSIIIHKKETWGNDPKMQDYLRPATLFGSVNKFHTYLDDATNYWIKKAKQTL